MPHYWPYNWHWFTTFFGLNNGSGPQYLFWSGVAGSFLTAMIGFGFGYWWHHNCHQHKCWRVGRHQFNGDSGAIWKYCRKHHPVLQGTRHDVKTHPDTAHLFK